MTRSNDYSNRDLFIFVGHDEVICALPDQLTQTVEAYFIEGGRDILEYDVSTVDMTRGVGFAMGSPRVDDADGEMTVDLLDADSNLLPARIRVALGAAA